MKNKERIPVPLSRGVVKSKYFEISGYWKDNKEPFEGYIVKEFDDYNEAEDDFVFEFGWGERDLEEVLNKETVFNDWVLTSYKEKMTLSTKRYVNITLKPVMVDIDGRNLEEAVEVSGNGFSFDVFGHSAEEVEEILISLIKEQLKN
jgi:hypothetical protein